MRYCCLLLWAGACLLGCSNAADEAQGGQTSISTLAPYVGSEAADSNATASNGDPNVPTPVTFADLPAQSIRWMADSNRCLTASSTVVPGSVAFVMAACDRSTAQQFRGTESGQLICQQNKQCLTANGNAAPLVASACGGGGQAWGVTQSVGWIVSTDNANHIPLWVTLAANSASDGLAVLSASAGAGALRTSFFLDSVPDTSSFLLAVSESSNTKMNACLHASGAALSLVACSAADSAQHWQYGLNGRIANAAGTAFVTRQANSSVVLGAAASDPNSFWVWTFGQLSSLAAYDGSTPSLQQDPYTGLLRVLPLGTRSQTWLALPAH